jgi:hypothetical protein
MATDRLPGQRTAGHVVDHYLAGLTTSVDHHLSYLHLDVVLQPHPYPYPQGPQPTLNLWCPRSVTTRCHLASGGARQHHLTHGPLTLLTFAYSARNHINGPRRRGWVVTSVSVLNRKRLRRVHGRHCRRSHRHKLVDMDLGIRAAGESLACHQMPAALRELH